MSLHIKYLKDALAQAEKDAQKVKDELEYYIHVDTNNKQHIQDYLRMYKEEGSEYITKRSEKLVNIEFAMGELKNIIWRYER